jgi:hypothetical protein
MDLEIVEFMTIFESIMKLFGILLTPIETNLVGWLDKLIELSKK